MGLLLFIIASILWIPLTIINLIVVIVKNIKTRGFFRVINGFFLSTATDIDKFGNSNFRTLLNSALINDEGVTFGDRHETISSVLGKNQRDNTLTRIGKVISGILDWLDKDHCKKSIKGS